MTLWLVLRFLISMATLIRVRVIGSLLLSTLIRVMSRVLRVVPTGRFGCRLVLIV